MQKSYTNVVLIYLKNVLKLFHHPYLFVCNLFSVNERCEFKQPCKTEMLINCSHSLFFLNITRIPLEMLELIHNKNHKLNQISCDIKTEDTFLVPWGFLFGNRATCTMLKINSNLYSVTMIIVLNF